MSFISDPPNLKLDTVFNDSSEEGAEEMGFS
jgi:hypothetical protein